MSVPRRTRQSGDDRFRDECGVFGVFNHREAANLTYLGLHGLQHRGQESAGIVSSNGERLFESRGMGQVAEVFRKKKDLAKLKGRMAIGHVRYSTAGESLLTNAQPLRIGSHRGEISLCHNGNLVNARILRRKLEKRGSIFQTTSDTEVVLHLIARSSARGLDEAIVDALGHIDGAFSMVFLTPDRMIGVRDPRGFRPLSIGRMRDAWILTSETCALDLIGAQPVREVEPGEIVFFTANGIDSIRPFAPVEPAACIFEYVYFSRPDSIVFGKNVSHVRRRMGAELAREAPAEADLVLPVPDSGVYAALGYSSESGIPFEFGLVRNHYIGRTFIEPEQSIRHFGVKLKMNPVRSLIEGKRVILIDDSIVRGTTSRKIVAMVRAAGARQVHVRISCPPTIGPCYYGVDTPSKAELIASSHTVEEIRKYIRADSLSYLSLEGMLRAVDSDSPMFCTACYTDRYPIAVPDLGAEVVRLPRRAK
jgi:amidophosphoribosyltransferase